MKIFQSAAAFAAARGRGAPPTSVAIGTFDGVHLGHQALLAEARRAVRGQAQSVALTFYPHPARVLAPAKAPPLIMPLERRLALLADTGMDVTVVQPFTREFSTLSADEFIRDVLVRDLGASSVVVGPDFRFGRGRAGDVQLLETLGRELSLSVSVIAPVTVGTPADGQRCSSTRIRQLVEAGDVRAARWLLGRPFELEGPVVQGAARGRDIGFPTANVVPDTELRPAVGIYAARAVSIDGRATGTTHPAAVSIGRNPTFEAQGAPVTVEAHLLDFAGDLYGRRLRLELWERLRDEQKFESVEALVAQIAADVARVRELMS